VDIQKQESISDQKQIKSERLDFNANGQNQSPSEIIAAAEVHEQERIDRASGEDRATGRSEYLGDMAYAVGAFLKGLLGHAV
jgi:hypothetical protein